MNTDLVKIELETIKEQATAGFFIGLFLDFSGPSTSIFGYKSDWINHYSENNYVVSDPSFAWAVSNDGTIRWSELYVGETDIRSSMAEHGLLYGATASVLYNKKRSLATFSRSDREFTDQELVLLYRSVKKIHIANDQRTGLTQLEKKTLNLLVSGYTSKEVSGLLSVSDQTIKMRLMTLRRKFGAKTNIELAAIVSKLNIIG